MAKWYNEAFAGKFVTPYVAEGTVSAWAQYAILAESTAQRDHIIAHLNEKHIPNMVYYPTPQHALPVFRDEPHYSEQFANANDYCARTDVYKRQVLHIPYNDCMQLF